MYVKEELCFGDLMDKAWSGALDTLQIVSQFNKESELMYLLEVLFYEEIPSLTEVNDYLWFESDYIFEMLGINEYEEDEEEWLKIIKFYWQIENTWYN